MAIIFAAVVSVLFYILLYLSVASAASDISGIAFGLQVAMMVGAAVIWAVLLKKSKRRFFSSIVAIPLLTLICSVPLMIPSLLDFAVSGLGEAVLLIFEYIFLMCFVGVLVLISAVYAIIYAVKRKKSELSSESDADDQN